MSDFPKSVFAAALLISSVGSAFANDLAADYRLERSVASDTELSAAVGDELFVVSEPLEVPGAIIEGSLANWRHEVPTGTVLVERRYEKDGSAVYCTREQTLKNAFGGDAGRSCFVDSDGDGQFDQVAALLFYRGGEFTTAAKKKGMEPIPYELALVAEKEPVVRYVVTLEDVAADSIAIRIEVAATDGSCMYASERISAPLSEATSDGIVLPLPFHLHLDDSKYRNRSPDWDDNFGTRLFVVAREEDSLRYRVSYLEESYWRYWPKDGGVSGTFPLRNLKKPNKAPKEIWQDYRTDGCAR